MGIGLIALIVFAGLGALMFFAPDMCVRADMKGDPDAEAKVKNFGKMCFGAAAAAGVLMLKYTLT